jgi:hypothetical protein
MNIVMERVCDDETGKCATRLQQRLVIALRSDGGTLVEPDNSDGSIEKWSLETVLGRNLTRLCRVIDQTSVAVDDSADGWKVEAYGDFVVAKSKSKTTDKSKFSFDRMAGKIS